MSAPQTPDVAEAPIAARRRLWLLVLFPLAFVGLAVRLLVPGHWLAAHAHTLRTALPAVHLAAGLVAWYALVRRPLFSLRGWAWASVLLIGMMAVQSVVVQRGLGPADRPGWLAWQFVRLIVLIGLAEELWFRGVWFEIVGRNALLSVVAGGALFGLSHLHQGLLMVLITGSAGCAYAAARHRGASLLSLALAHGLMDFANGILFPGAAARFSLTAIMVIAPALILTVALALMLIGRWPLRFRAKMGKRQEPHGSQAAD
ncbi:MAG: CPBP family intramembrane metalloprotease [Planctomycetes bacterium]|nr:CPBP family intramembrane metalloprotease [Planctomycetota bacterium]